jgi:hypothetical protein
LTYFFYQGKDKHDDIDYNKTRQDKTRQDKTTLHKTTKDYTTQHNNTTQGHDPDKHKHIARQNKAMLKTNTNSKITPNTQRSAQAQRQRQDAEQDKARQDKARQDQNTHKMRHDFPKTTHHITTQTQHKARQDKTRKQYTR